MKRTISTDSANCLFFGDVFLDKPYAGIAGNLMVINHEYVVNDNGTYEPEGHHICLNVGEEYVDQTFDAKNLLLSFANNHALDFGIDCLKKNMKSLEDKGMACFGAGSAVDDFNSVCVIETDSAKKVGVLFYCCRETYSYDDRAYKEWGISVFSRERFQKHMKELGSSVDRIVVYIHWGEEYLHVPNTQQTDLAEYLGEKVDLIVGSHSHSIQLTKKEKSGCKTFYSCGNTILPSLTIDNNLSGHSHNWDKINNLSISVELDLHSFIIRHHVYEFQEGRLTKVGNCREMMVKSFLFLFSQLPVWIYPKGRWFNIKFRNLRYKIKARLKDQT